MRTCSAALAFVFAFAITLPANAGKVFYDDFEDGSATDGNPVNWVPVPGWSSGTREVIDGSFVHTPRGLGGVDDEMDTEVAGEIYQDVSIRTRVLAGKGNDVALFARSTFVDGSQRSEFQFIGGFFSSGELTLRYAGVNPDGGLFAATLQDFSTGWTPSAQDIYLQMDLIGDILSLTGWLDGAAKPSQPQLIANIGSITDGNLNEVERGTVGVFVVPHGGRDIPAPQPVAFRYVEVVPEPSTGGLALGLILAAWAFRRRGSFAR